jgi:hypothetical protein
MSMAPSQLGAFTRSSPDQPWPNIEYHVQPLSLDAFGEPLHSFPAFTASVCNLNPTSRGTVQIKSADFQDAPAIAPNYLSTPEDRKVAADSLRVTRRIVAQPALAATSPRNGSPARSTKAMKTWRGWRATLPPPSSTPWAPPRWGATTTPWRCSTPRLRVRGIDGLRVVDAGAMPTITSGNTNSPTLMLAEKGRAVDLEDGMDFYYPGLAARRLLWMRSWAVGGWLWCQRCLRLFRARHRPRCWAPTRPQRCGARPWPPGNTAAACRCAGLPCCPLQRPDLHGAFAGAWAVTVVSADFLRKLLPLVLLGVLVYTLAKKELGRHHKPRHEGRAEVLIASLIGLRSSVFMTASSAPVPAASSFFCSCACWATTFSTPRPRPSCSTAPPTSRPSCAVCRQGPCVVALRRDAGGGQHGGQPAGHAHGAQARHRLCARHFHRGGEHFDPQDGLRRLPALKPHAGHNSVRCDAAGGQGCPL